MDQEEFFTSPLLHYLTMNDMARRLGVPLGRVRAGIEALRLHSARRVGVVRLWTPSQLQQLRRWLEPSPRSEDEQAQ